ncbi:MAG: hypothetical protein DI529_07955 [Chryseobacterium sp.]|nr:MAG: hypothetical protein DI529_07955 [Chryseobacterium sp.]
MQKFYSFILVLITSFLFAQNYSPLLVEGNKWHVTLYDGSTSPTCLYITQQTTYAYKIAGDSIVNGKTYKKIVFDFTGYPYIRTCGTTNNQQNNFAALLREDVNEKKIYKIINGTTDEVVLYDFSINIGDAIPHLGYDFDNNSGNNVNAISRGDVFNKNVKVFATSNSYIYEGIGSASGLLEFPRSRPFETGRWLECFETSSGISCNSILANSESVFKSSNPKLYFSKADKSFKVITPENKNINVEFFDSAGQLVKQINTKTNQSFYLNRDFKGLLFYKITDDKMYSGKIILE